MDALQARKLAYFQAKKIDFEIKENSLETFLTINFNIPNSETVDQETVARQNLELDPASCLGRVAVVAAIMELYHPKINKLELGEVWDDFFKNFMLAKLRRDPNLADDPTFMRELLMYEEPHAVVVVDGTQLEPLSLEFGEIVRHPGIGLFPLWEGLAASTTMSEAWLTDDPAEKLSLLDQAEKLCPGLVLISENKAEVLELQGKVSEAIQCVRWCLEKRPCARTLLVMNLLSLESKYYDRLTEIYTEKIIDHILGGGN